MERQCRPLVAALVAWLALPGSAGAIEAFGGRLQLHGALSEEIRTVADGYRVRDHLWFMSAMRTKLTLELEADLLTESWGPLDLVSSFARLDVQYDCIYDHACHMAPQWSYFGDDVRRAPENLADGRTRGITGVLPNPLEPVVREQPDQRLLTVADVDPFSTLLALGNAESIQSVFGEIFEAKITTKYMKGSLSPLVFAIGPLNPEYTIDSTGVFADRPSETPALPLRPAADSLFIPSPALVPLLENFDNPDVNFSEDELQWDLGASQQQTKFLREAYLDVTMLDGRLVLRLGKQITRWGKTELFRAQDQLNPQDLAISNLPSFEDSLIPLWQARAIYSLYQVGPLEDFRIELAANLDHFEPADLGDCGEPYTVWLVCQKQFGLLAHGFSALGVAGEERPQDWWNRGSGLEFGVRVEFRWRRFAFAITDFYGYTDFPTPDYFFAFERNADPATGRPRIAWAQGIGTCTTGAEADCLRVDNALALHPGNRQLLDVFCAATLGFSIPGSFGSFVGDALDNTCAVNLFNETTELLPIIPGFTIPFLAANALRGGPVWSGLVALLCSPAALNLGPGCLPATAELDVGTVVGGVDFDDPLGSQGALSEGLTAHQEALLGCGPFYYGSDDGAAFAAEKGVVILGPYDGSCTRLGMDLFQTEASVLFQRFPHMESGGIPLRGPVGTRFLEGVGPIQLPGARSPFEFFDQPQGFRYDPRLDGCVVDLNATPELQSVRAALEAQETGLGAACDGTLISVPLDGGGTRVLSVEEIRQRFPNEMAIVSENFLKLLVAVAQITQGPASGCGYGPSDGLGDAEAITRCEFVNALFEATAVQRPDLEAGGNGHFGRRDFTWLAGSAVKLFYERRNVLGVSADFTEDWSKTSWGVEFVWFEDEPYVNSRADRGFSLEDTLSLAISVDRPTFVNFLNANRTIFFNAQVFIQYIPDWEGSDTFDVDGPVSAIGTFTAFTGFWQDRLMTFLTLVHEAQSNSGGQIFSLIYRFSESFSLSLGVSAFYGAPSRSAVTARSPVTRFHCCDYTQRSNYQGVSAISERDEIFFVLRKTF